MRTWLAAFAAVALIAALGCGAYGPPERASETPTTDPSAPEEERKKEQTP